MNSGELTRLLLEQIGNIVMQSVPVKKKMDMIVQLIARELCVGVCSIYMLNKHGRIELSATEGLSRESVNAFSFEVGQGIVGQIFKNKLPVNVLNVWNNEFFIYFPETAEDPYYTMVGVPIVLDEHVVGALVVQNRPNRPHMQDHQKILETLSAILSGLIARSDFEIGEQTQTSQKGIHANFISEGCASGMLVTHEPSKILMYSMLDSRDDKDLEVFNTIFSEEFNFLCEDDRDIISSIDERCNFRERIVSHIRAGLEPTSAIYLVYNLIVIVNKFGSRSSQVFEKFSTSIILSIIDEKFLKQNERDDGIIIVADTLSSQELLMYMEIGLRGAILSSCSQGSHISILAESLGIPIVFCPSFVDLGVKDGSYAYLDSKCCTIEVGDKCNFSKDKINVKPIRNYGLKTGKLDFSTIEALMPGISLLANVNLLCEAEDLAKSKLSDSVGLVRTEMLFGHLPDLPTERLQTKTYQKLFSYIKPEKCIVRLFDLCASLRRKSPLSDTSDNAKGSAMSMRGVRILIDEPSILRVQVRALLSAAGGSNVYVTVPMVACLEEWMLVKEIISTIDGADKVKLGLLVEVPSAAYELKNFMPYVDFVQVGTNDLAQFFYAIDRDCQMYKTVNLGVLTRPFLSLLKGILDTSVEAGKRCIVCGIAASKLYCLIAMYKLGFRSFSVPVPELQSLCTRLTEVDIQKTMDAISDAYAENIYDLLKGVE